VHFVWIKFWIRNSDLNYFGMVARYEPCTNYTDLFRDQVNAVTDLCGIFRISASVGITSIRQAALRRQMIHFRNLPVQLLQCFRYQTAPSIFVDIKGLRNYNGILLDTPSIASNIKT
jgi:hypothetical protein